MTYPQYPQQPQYPQTPYPQQFPGYPQQPMPPAAPPVYGAQYPVAAPLPPANNLALAIFGLLFFWPVGLAAVLYAAKVDSMYARGQWQAAYVTAERAKRCGILAIVFGCIGGFLYFMLRVTLVGR